MNTSLTIFNPRAAAFTSARLERLCTGAIWSEGPVYLPQDGSVLWSDIPNNRILRWSENAGMTVWRDHVEFTNGHTLDNEGNLLHCSHGLRAIVRTPAIEGKILAATTDETLVTHYNGKRLNSPNDVIVDSKGRIWFSDPPYGILSDREGHKADIEQNANHVFCYDPHTEQLHAVTDWVQEPNGLAFSPDEKLLYVSDTSAALREDGNHHIVVFDVQGTQLSKPRIFAEISPGLPDGFRIDSQGLVYTSSEDSVQILHPDGRLLGKIPVPEKVGNLCFAGKNEKIIFVAASTSLYRITFQ